MFNSRLIKMIVLGVYISLQSAHAFTSPIGVGFLPPVQFPPQKHSVAGVRLSLLNGVNEQVYGFDLSMSGNTTKKRFVGTAVAGIYNLANETTILGFQLAGISNLNPKGLFVLGVQAGGLFNYNAKRVRIIGVQFSGLINNNFGKSNIIGLQLAGVANNSHSSYVSGLQLSAFNSAWQIRGLQVGVFNDANSVYGLQIGIVNYTEELHGLQIGLINLNKGGPLKFFPVINFGF